MGVYLDLLWLFAMYAWFVVLVFIGYLISGVGYDKIMTSSRNNIKRYMWNISCDTYTPCSTGVCVDGGCLTKCPVGYSMYKMWDNTGLKSICTLPQ